MEAGTERATLTQSLVEIKRALNVECDKDRKRHEEFEAKMQELIERAKVLRAATKTATTALEQNTPTATTGPVRETAVEHEPIYRPRQMLPHVPEFSGDYQTYPLWKAQMMAKLECDGLSIGGPDRQFSYIFARLRDGAQIRMQRFYQNQPKELGQPKELRTPEEFLRAMDNKFPDSILDRCKMGNDDDGRLSGGSGITC
ncbi:hypothetical protein SEPCBS119000_002219 [Sporothrix epigloea]|uniref:Uncharacterized protein n=1 Tax=Sporothrix epigloea TaxID=1892477 RepID=A0ABP0DIZ6_9PEZI